MKLLDVVRLKQDVLDMPKDSTGTIVEALAPGVWEVEFSKVRKIGAPSTIITVKEEEMEVEWEAEELHAE